MKGYPSWFLRTLVAALLLVFVTGLLLAPTTLALRGELDLPWRLPGAGRVPTAALHAAGSFALLLLIGALWSVHMRSGWRRRRQRASGLVLGLMLLLLAASAVAVYYLGDETLGAVCAFLHLGTGLALAVPFGWHWVHGRRVRRLAQLHAAGHRSPTPRHHGPGPHRPRQHPPRVEIHP